MERGNPTRPNFFVIGAHKAGTTSLCELLASHPDVFLSTPKEPGFFSWPHVRSRGYGWYESLFANAGQYQAIGEGSTTYSQCGVFPHTAKLIADYVPEARIIYIVRHPLQRIESAWIQYRSQKRTDVPRSFARAVRSCDQLVDASRYWYQLSRFRELFPDEHILVLFFEDLIADPLNVVRRCFEHLGVSSSVDVPEAGRPRNASAGKYQEPTIVSRLRRNQAVGRLLALGHSGIGHQAKGLLKGLVTRPIERPTWDAETLTWVVEQVKDDAQIFLKRSGRPPDFWSLQ